jgi:hypothetical protein
MRFMEPYVLLREMQVNEKSSNRVVEAIRLSAIPIEQLILIFGEQPNDPLFYGDYQIDEESGKYFPGINFDHEKFDYYLLCWRELTNQELEILTINRYFKKDKAKRYVDFVLKDKTRAKFISELAHLHDLEYSKFQKVERDEKASIRSIIDKRKLTKCYVISEDKRIDRQFLEIELALERTIGYCMGTILVFGNAEVIYYEGEEPKNRWISVSV